MVKTKLGKGLWGEGGEKSSPNKKSPCKVYRTPKDVSVDWLLQEAGAETELECKSFMG